MADPAEEPDEDDDDRVPSIPQAWESLKPGKLDAKQVARQKEIVEELDACQRTYVEAGGLLTELSGAETNTALWSGNYDNFPAYCEETFGLRRSKVYRLMQASKVAKTLIGKGHPAPTNENMAVALWGLSAEKMSEVWGAVLKEPGRPTIKKVTEKRAELQPKRKYDRKDGGDQPLTPHLKSIGKIRKGLSQTFMEASDLTLDKAAKAELRKHIDEVAAELDQLRKLTV